MANVFIIPILCLAFGCGWISFTRLAFSIAMGILGIFFAKIFAVSVLEEKGLHLGYSRDVSVGNFAMCDLCALSLDKTPLFSYAGCQTGNGDIFCDGFGYSLSYLRNTYQDNGRSVGPIIWFWFTPFVIDSTHGGIKVGWIWK